MGTMRTHDVTRGMLLKVRWPESLPDGKPILLQAGMTPEEARSLLPTYRKLLSKYGVTGTWFVFEGPVTHSPGPQTHGIYADMYRRAPLEEAAEVLPVGDQLEEDIQDRRVRQFLGV